MDNQRMTDGGESDESAPTTCPSAAEGGNEEDAGPRPPRPSQAEGDRSENEDEEPAGVTETLGRRRWAIAEGFIPSESTGPEPAMTSHETACLLNAGDRDAHVRITLYFADREPVGPYEVVVPARRTRHLRFNELDDPEPVPRDADYASLIESDVPIVVQHTRLDSRQAENALLSTVAYAEG